MPPLRCADGSEAYQVTDQGARGVAGKVVRIVIVVLEKSVGDPLNGEFIYDGLLLSHNKWPQYGGTGPVKGRKSQSKCRHPSLYP